MICISNPPYNIKWEVPGFAKMEQRFCECGVPPKSNANYAFVLSGFEKADYAIYILPCGVLESDVNEEKYIRKQLVDKNYLEAVIVNPNNMFEDTDIATCIIILNKRKSTTDVTFVDMRDTYTERIREQKGQYGGKSKTNRTYKKTFKCFDNEQIEKCINAIRGRHSIENFCRTVSPAMIVEAEYSFSPSSYIDFRYKQPERRTYTDIVRDLNRVIEKRNSCKLVINETIAKNVFGFDIESYKSKNDSKILLPKCLNLKIADEDYITLTKNKNELIIKNNSNEEISEVFIFALRLWRHNVALYNNEENRLLAELRDKLLPDLLSGNMPAELEK